MLVIRAWQEAGSSNRVHARITQTLDADEPNRKETVAVAAGKTEILAAVRSWLEAFSAQS